MDDLVDHSKPKELVSVVGEAEAHVVGCTDNSNGGDFSLGQQGDETDDGSDGSSSFGNTCSDGDNGKNMSDNEVDSSYAEANLSEGLDSFFRPSKKKVTPQWRTLGNPLAWRLKWAGLRLKEMYFQKSLYEKELTSYVQREPQLELGQCTKDDDNGKPLLFSGKGSEREIMKRRKRNKVEDTVDISSYMSQHNLFSFHENKKKGIDCSLADEKSSNPVIEITPENVEMFNTYYPPLEICDDTLEHVLWKIEIAHSRVQKQRNEINKLVTENASMFSDYESLTELRESQNDQANPFRSPPIPAAMEPIVAERLPVVVLDTPPPVVHDHLAILVPSNVEAAPEPDEISIVPSSKERWSGQSYFTESQKR